MLYTIVPIEDVLGAAAPLPIPTYGDLALGERRVVVAFASDGRPRLERLISTDPLDYLDPRLQPGAALDWAFPAAGVAAGAWRAAGGAPAGL